MTKLDPKKASGTANNELLMSRPLRDTLPQVDG